MTKSLLGDALPDLIIGLVGVPVAFAIQEIAQGILPELQYVQKLDWLDIQQYAIGVIFILGIYAIYSISTLLTFEQSTNQKTDYFWLLLPFQILVAIGITAIVIALGKYYPDLTIRSWLAIFVLFILSSAQPVSVVLSGNNLLSYWRENRDQTIKGLGAGFLLFLVFVLFTGII